MVIGFLAVNAPSLQCDAYPFILVLLVKACRCEKITCKLWTITCKLWKISHVILSVISVVIRLREFFWESRLYLSWLRLSSWYACHCDATKLSEFHTCWGGWLAGLQSVYIEKQKDNTLLTMAYILVNCQHQVTNLLRNFGDNGCTSHERFFLGPSLQNPEVIPS